MHVLNLKQNYLKIFRDLILKTKSEKNQEIYIVGESLAVSSKLQE